MDLSDDGCQGYADVITEKWNGNPTMLRISISALARAVRDAAQERALAEVRDRLDESGVLPR